MTPKESRGKQSSNIDQESLRQYYAVREHAGLFDLSLRGKIKITGPDRISFLNNILTNDIKALKPGQGCYSMLLTAPAKVLAEMNILIFSDHILLDVDVGYAKQTMERINKLLIAEDVQMENQDDVLTHFSIQGPRSNDLLKTLFPRDHEIKLRFDHITANLGDETVIVIRRDRFGYGFDFILSQDSHQKFKKELLATGAELGLKEANEKVKEILRIEHGILRFGVDFDEKTMLPETGLEKIAASETKGCYPGQEVVAKIVTYGGLNRKIVGFTHTGDERLKPGDKISFEGKDIGRITSGCYSPILKSYISLGMLSKPYFGGAAREALFYCSDSGIKLRKTLFA